MFLHKPSPVDPKIYSTGGVFGVSENIGDVGMRFNEPNETLGLSRSLAKLFVKGILPLVQGKAYKGSLETPRAQINHVVQSRDFPSHNSASSLELISRIFLLICLFFYIENRKF